MSGQPVDRITDLPERLRWDVGSDSGLEVPIRHIEKKAWTVVRIAWGGYAMSRTEKNIDAEWIEAVRSELKKFIQTLKIDAKQLENMSKRKSVWQALNLRGVNHSIRSQG